MEGVLFDFHGFSSRVTYPGFTEDVRVIAGFSMPFSSFCTSNGDAYRSPVGRHSKCMHRQKVMSPTFVLLASMGEVCLYHLILR
jgi:hypothetical protein